MASYTPLLRQGKFPNDEDDHEPHFSSVDVCECNLHSGKRADTHWKKYTWTLKFAVYACLASLVCTFLNISFLALRQDVATAVSNEVKYTHNAVHDPNEPPPDPISTWPDLAAQISQTAPGTVFYENNTGRRFTNFGMAYPTDRTFRVTAGVRTSTVVQFRGRDFGMEKCTLTLVMGMTSPTMGHGHGRDASEHAYTARGRLDVWQLAQATNRRLDPERLSWNTRPTRARLLTSWDLATAASATLRSDEFACASTSIVTLELACASASDCALAFVQPREQPESALLLIQRSSL
ncbi:hypothetical protein GGX14DRAFT_553890 [Mycena pura]|uniref:Ubiquitin 3 binding protein But2 C-terminal domain-containing protein n=1 Tax=Mycena pura TaxID=153505 RepID=A0AAD6YVW9_9AGAR|nr:hypothetical protein GGX14DRAFT_553890 [Mycena pura]